jgi:hypothetical protein
MSAVTIRGLRSRGIHWKLEAWDNVLTIGAPLPTIPIWLTYNQSIPLPLEQTYETTCKALRIR